MSKVLIDAINALYNEKRNLLAMDADRVANGVQVSIKVIESLPSAEIPQWIPCSERLPNEKEGVYLICTDYGYLCSCRWTNDVYGLGATEWSAWGWHRLDVPQYSRVVAWMDLKPWKGADDE